MQLVFHTGAHFTEEDRLMKSLLRNAQLFHEKGVAVPGPGKYRKLLRDTVAAMDRSAVSADVRDILIEAFLDRDDVDRVILSHAHLLGWPRAAVRNGLIYPNAPDRIAKLAYIFQSDRLELFMAVRNPATFLPACFERNPRDSLSDFLGGVDPRKVRWSETFKRLRVSAPEVPITVWCAEDAPLLWATILRDMAGLTPQDAVEGSTDLFGDIVSEAGLARFKAYVQERPEMQEIHLRRVMAAFMEKYALDHKIEERLDLPELTVSTVDEMTQIYDEDVQEIGRIPGVELISP